MKKITTIFMAMALAVVMMPLAASAQTYVTRRVYRNGHWQTVRVYNQYGQRGRITPKERRKLNRERSRIYRTARRDYRDGRLSRHEARKLRKKERKYYRHVRRARNN